VRISKSEEYGLRLVMRLASNGGRLTIRELAEQEQLPDTTVAKVVSRLRRAELVRAERGRNGGYSLSSAADRISVARVVEAFDNRIYDPEFCDRMSPGDGSCAHSSACGLRPVWRGLTAVIADFLAGITVADVIAGGVPGPRQGLPIAAGRES
jgi:Rrf2 family nitric oxide-sensitive transcriptional repressor